MQLVHWQQQGQKTISLFLCYTVDSCPHHRSSVVLLALQRSLQCNECLDVFDYLKNVLHH